MEVVNLKLLNFRNYARLTLKFSPKLNIIYGGNGSGKTNLIEAIYVLALTKSFRGSNDKILINKDKNLTKISGGILDNINKEYQLTISLDGKVAKIDGKRQSKLSDYVSKINVVLFHPDCLKIIKETPSIRRDNLNIDIAQLDNNYLKLTSDYQKLLRQRNAYLKVMYMNANKSVDYLNILTDKLIEVGMKIYQKRKTFLEYINQYIGKYYEKISGISTLKLKYHSDYEDKDFTELKKIYAKSREKDMLFGNTTLGVHHDDYDFCFDDEPLKDFASQGQQKNAVIAYKLTLIRYFKEKKGVKPILILDDLFSELDNEKIRNILETIDDDLQTFITITDLDKLPDGIRNSECKIYFCSDGMIREDI